MGIRGADDQAIGLVFKGKVIGKFPLTPDQGVIFAPGDALADTEFHENPLGVVIRRTAGHPRQNRPPGQVRNHAGNANGLFMDVFYDFRG